MVNSESPSQTASLFPVLLVNFIGTLGFSIVLPFLVFVVLRFGGNALIFGIAGSAGGLASILGLIAGGLLFQKTGASTFLISAALILVACGVALPWLRTSPHKL